MSSDDRESLSDKLRRDLEASQWLQKYRQMGQSLLALKEKIPLSTLCKVEWLTETDTLSIRCPNPEIREGLLKQASAIAALDLAAASIVVRCEGLPDVGL